MKRIIDGVTYNTDTSTRLAESEYGATYNLEDCQCEGTLYQTRGGAYFVHEQLNLGYNRELAEEMFKERFVALSPKGAQDWMMTGEVEVFHNPFAEPPEAAAETEPGATLYVRVPASLKTRIEEAARNDSSSLNAWALRCMEQCLMNAAKETAVERMRQAHRE